MKVWRGIEWLWTIVTAVVGWRIGHRQSREDRKRGVEEGAQAVFGTELAFGFALSPRLNSSRLLDRQDNRRWTRGNFIGLAVIVFLWADLLGADTGDA